MKSSKGFGKISNRNDPYGYYIGEFVEVKDQLGVNWGRYQGINGNDSLVLRHYVDSGIILLDRKNQVRQSQCYETAN